MILSLAKFGLSYNREYIRTLFYMKDLYFVIIDCVFQIAACDYNLLQSFMAKDTWDVIIRYNWWQSHIFDQHYDGMWHVLLKDVLCVIFLRAVRLIVVFICHF